jgi:dTDP-4-amino-4,6-dideoxygalactose transaminase
MQLWSQYHDWSAKFEGRLQRPALSPDGTHNAHMYYLVLPDLQSRTNAIAALKERGIQSVFHYLPLHEAPAGRRYGRAHGELPVTVRVSDTLMRLPLWVGLEPHMERVQAALDEVLNATIP